MNRVAVNFVRRFLTLDQKQWHLELCLGLKFPQIKLNLKGRFFVNGYEIQTQYKVELNELQQMNFSAEAGK